MRKYLESYLEYILEKLEKDDRNTDYNNLLKEHLVQISFMQHERLVHLIVTCLFSLVLIITIGFFCTTSQLAFGALSVLIILLLTAYIRHYYFLENSVQKMYEIYNRLLELSAKEACISSESGACHEEKNL
ncbi:MAG: hypothetical protein ACI4I9_03780 [Porcipelethomonas sp.]